MGGDSVWVVWGMVCGYCRECVVWKGVVWGMRGMGGDSV